MRLAGLPALALLKFLDVVKPWRLTGGESTRDVWRVGCIRILVPWVSGSWRRRVPHLARQFANTPLLAALKARGEPPIIGTVGFKPIVTPLIAALGFADSRIICARVNFRDRRNGKLQLIANELGTAVMSRATVVTDSIDDLPLLAACAKPLRTVWPAARYRPALRGVYVPGRYLTYVKRPGQRYLWRGIVQEDYAFWLLSSLGLAIDGYRLAVGLLLLLASFWAIYERGYVDNDWVAANYERDPKLSATFHEHDYATPTWQPWIWAVLLGAAGVAVLRQPAVPALADFGKWAGVLIATEWWFRLYNRFDKSTRVWLYPVLQFGRSAAFVVLVPITAIGAMALGAHTLSRWVPYYAYRIRSGGWPDTHPQLIRLLFFVVLAVFLAVASGWSAVLNTSGALLLIWSLYRGWREIAAAVRSAVRLRNPHQGGRP